MFKQLLSLAKFGSLAVAVLLLLTISSCEINQGGQAANQQGNQREPNYYFNDDFESYTNGESLSANKPFDNAGRTVASTEQSYSGRTSAKMSIEPRDNGGFGLWGGSINIQPTVKKGGEVWVRLRVYWPSSFQFSATPWMKFMRLHNKNGTTFENAGYNDIYIYKADETTNVIGCIKEGHNRWEFYDGPKIPRDTWETYEMYLFVDDKSVDQGGQGRMRLWRDGKLIFNRTDVPTISEPTGFINLLHIFTYWNNENPPSNYCYIDDLTIATQADPPIKRDSQGNLFIGM